MTQEILATHDLTVPIVDWDFHIQPADGCMKLHVFTAYDTPEQKDIPQRFRSTELPLERFKDNPLYSHDIKLFYDEPGMKIIAFRNLD